MGRCWARWRGQSRGQCCCPPPSILQCLRAPEHQTRQAGQVLAQAQADINCPLLLCIWEGTGMQFACDSCGIQLFPCVGCGFFSEGLGGGTFWLGSLPTCISRPPPCRICNLAELAAAGWGTEAEKGAGGGRLGGSFLAAPSPGFPGASCQSRTCIKGFFLPMKLGS